MDITEKFVEYDTAKLAFDKGIVNDYVIEQLASVYNIHQEHVWTYAYQRSWGWIPCLSQAALQRILREKYKMHVRVDNVNQPHIGKWSYEIQKLPSGIINLWNEDVEVYDTYEEAMEKGLTHALKIIS